MIRKSGRYDYLLIAFVPNLVELVLVPPARLLSPLLLLLLLRGEGGQKAGQQVVRLARLQDVVNVAAAGPRSFGRLGSSLKKIEFKLRKHLRS